VNSPTKTYILIGLSRSSQYTQTMTARHYHLSYSSSISGPIFARTPHPLFNPCFKMSTQQLAIWVVICEMLQDVVKMKPETARVLSRLFRRTSLRPAPLRSKPAYFDRGDDLCELVFEDGRSRVPKRIDCHITHSTYLLGVTVGVLGRSIQPLGHVSQAGYFRLNVRK